MNDPAPLMRQCECGPPPYECVLDHEVLTRLNEADGSFTYGPRSDAEREYSVFRGDLSAEEALTARLKRVPSERQLANRDVVKTTAGVLRGEGFGVIHSPGGKLLNQKHVSVVHPSGMNEEPEVPWPAAQVRRLELVFNHKLQGGE